MLPIRISRGDGSALADQAFSTVDVSERIAGWSGLSEVRAGDGLLIAPCASIHTLGMRFSLDLVFLGPDLKVLKVRRDMKPNRIAFAPLSMLLASWRSQVLELPAGTVARTGLKPGEFLTIQERPI